MSGINTSYGNYSGKPVNSAKPADRTKAKNPEAAGEQAQQTRTADKRSDTFERTNRSSEKVTVDYKAKSALGIKNECMKDTIANLLGQAKSQKSTSTGPIDIGAVLRSYGVEPIEEDGSEDFWGAEKTANRILDFAKNLAGNNKEAFAKLKDAFGKAFGECEKIWGGSLPDVCYDTLDRVNQGFDDWENELNGSSAAEQ
jgi:hypothetical protein